MRIVNWRASKKLLTVVVNHATRQHVNEHLGGENGKVEASGGGNRACYAMLLRIACLSLGRELVVVMARSVPRKEFAGGGGGLLSMTTSCRGMT